MPSATPTAAAAAASCQNHHSTLHLSIKTFSFDTTNMLGPSLSYSDPIRTDGSDDVSLSKSEFLTRTELLNRRARRAKQLTRIYRDHYWALMEELKLKYREYYWEYGKSAFLGAEENENFDSNCGDSSAVIAEDVDNGNLRNHNSNFANRCCVHGCKAKVMALTRFCHMHVLFDVKQKLYKACNFSIKSSTTGPILCGKPVLRSTVPSYCPLHFSKAEKHMARALKKAGLNVSSASKFMPKFHVIVAEYIRQIQSKRRVVQKENLEVKEDNNS